mmetsp:Transcript_5699/g.7280  ORF Transcript_5699/g.7280 Transcript_5699/m.7280 type:complete len:563 (+) Transcript_5699:38-1726(+)
MEEQSHHHADWFWKLPIQRQRWGDQQVLPHVNWGDLFFDLFYVAAAYNLAYVIKSDLNGISVLYFFGCFGPLTGVFWTNKLTYDLRFQMPDDFIHVFIEVVRLCLVATAVAHIRPIEYMSHPETYPHMFTFCLTCWLGILLYLLLNLEIRFIGVVGEDASKYSCMTDVISQIPTFLFVTAATIAAGTKYFSGNDDHQYRQLAGSGNDDYTSEAAFHIPIALMVCSWLVRHSLGSVLIFSRAGKDFKKRSIPINVEFMIHRFGEWTMLMLGESILSLLIVELAYDSLNYYITFYLGILSVICLQYLYFKSQPHHPDGHAARRSRWAGVTFVALIQFYSAALIIVGVSYKMLLTEYGLESQYETSYDATDDKYSSTGSGRFLDRSTANVITESNRLLAGGSSGAYYNYTQEERRYRIASFFSAGLATSFLTLDLMNINHTGIQKSISMCHCPNTGKFRMKGFVFVVLLRLVVIIFVATIALYITEPELVALAGFCAISIQVIIRLIGAKYYHPLSFHHDVHEEQQNEAEKGDRFAHGQPNIVDEEVNEELWPNTTQAMSVPREE